MPAPGAISESKLARAEQKQRQTEERRRKNQLASVETRIAVLEARNEEIDAQFALPETGTDLPLCQKLSAEQAEISEELAALYEQWETLAE